MTYAEKLQDPRWNEKRVSILKRDNLTCQECEIQEVVLQVHHHFYHANTDPWDYDDEVLITLCEPCHAQEEMLKAFDLTAFQYLLTLGLTRNKISILTQAISKRLNKEGVDVKTEFANIINRIQNG